MGGRREEPVGGKEGKSGGKCSDQVVFRARQEAPPVTATAASSSKRVWLTGGHAFLPLPVAPTNLGRPQLRGSPITLPPVILSPISSNDNTNHPFQQDGQWRDHTFILLQRRRKHIKYNPATLSLYFESIVFEIPDLFPLPHSFHCRTDCDRPAGGLRTGTRQQKQGSTGMRAG